jgi:hypothetical protein
MENITNFRITPSSLNLCKNRIEVFQGGSSRAARDMAARVSDWYLPMATVSKKSKNKWMMSEEKTSQSISQGWSKCLYYRP